MDIKILQINIRGRLRSNTILEKFLQETKIDIAILSEIKINNKSKIKINGYEIFSNFKNNDGWPSGGVAIIVKKKFTVKSFSINKYMPIETIKINITNAKNNLNMVSVYIPECRNKELKSNFKKLVNDLFNNDNNTIIAGDFNAHHGLWNLTNKVDDRGVIISDILSKSNFSIVNNGDHTFFRMNNELY